MSQKYIVVSFLEPLENGFNFSCKEWPLHITLLPNFTIKGSLNELINKLGELASIVSAFDVEVGNNERFGPNGEVLVSLIKPNENILSLHNVLVDVAKLYVFDTPQYIGDGYRPHATVQLNNKLIRGQIKNINSITLVDMYPNNDIERRQTIETFKLK